MAVEPPKIFPKGQQNLAKWNDTVDGQNPKQPSGKVKKPSE